MKSIDLKKALIQSIFRELEHISGRVYQSRAFQNFIECYMLDELKFESITGENFTINPLSIDYVDNDGNEGWIQLNISNKNVRYIYDK